MTTARTCQPEVCQLVEKLGGKVVSKLWINNSLVVEVPAAARAALMKHPAVRSVRPPRRIPLPHFTRELSLRSDSEPVWSVSKIAAPAVWAAGIDGTGVVVGHIDTGVDGTHPDLAGRVVAFKDFVDPANTTPRDGQGHGTHTAGTICGIGAGGNKTGVAPGARLMVARVFTEEGATDDAIMGAMQWMMDPDGNPRTADAPRLCSNSWGSDDTTDRSFWEITKAWRAAGILPVFAAGNAGPGVSTVGIPGGYPHVFSVGATTGQDGAASFSSRGPVTWDGSATIKPDVSAPGAGVVSLRDGGGYATMSGTSMACPHVAGLVALLLAAYPEATPDTLIKAIQTTAIDLGAPGRDNVFGEGRVDAQKALGSLQGAGFEEIVQMSGSPLGFAADYTRPIAQSRIFRTLNDAR
jgi:subtilisin family serine protease